MIQVKEVERTTIKTDYFGSLTERMNKYREDVLNKKPYIDSERAILATKAYDKHKKKPNVFLSSKNSHKGISDKVGQGSQLCLKIARHKLALYNHSHRTLQISHKGYHKE